MENACIPAPLSDQRELNVIVHGMKEDKEDNAREQTNQIITELFDTLGLKHYFNTLADRLGRKSPDKNRPIRLTME